MSSGWGAPDTAPTRLVLLRHGQTPLSVERRFAGRGDIPLTGEGRAQAEAAARRLAAGRAASGRAGGGRAVGAIDVVVSSPLLRTRDTASRAADALGLPVEVDEGFVETDFGDWEGLTFAEARERAPEAVDRWLADPEVGPPGGESFAAVARRVEEARNALVERHRGRTVLVVTHVTPIKVTVQQALLAPLAALYRMHLDTACLTEVDVFADGPMLVRSLNDTAHLD